MKVKITKGMEILISKVAKKKKKKLEIYWERQREVLDWVNEQ